MGSPYLDKPKRPAPKPVVLDGCFMQIGEAVDIPGALAVAQQFAFDRWAYLYRDGRSDIAIATKTQDRLADLLDRLCDIEFDRPKILCGVRVQDYAHSGDMPGACWFVGPAYE